MVGEFIFVVKSALWCSKVSLPPIFQRNINEVIYLIIFHVM